MREMCSATTDPMPPPLSKPAQERAPRWSVRTGRQPWLGTTHIDRSKRHTTCCTPGCRHRYIREMGFAAVWQAAGLPVVGATRSLRAMGAVGPWRACRARPRVPGLALAARGRALVLRWAGGAAGHAAIDDFHGLMREALLCVRFGGRIRNTYSVSRLSCNGFKTRSMNSLRSSRYGSMTSSPAGHTARQYAAL